MSYEMSFKLRLKAEVKDLSWKIHNLRIFKDTDMYENLPIEEQALLTYQLKSMDDYYYFLSERIKIYDKV